MVRGSKLACPRGNGSRGGGGSDRRPALPSGSPRDPDLMAREVARVARWIDTLG
ncbi:hypothetical protein [Trebonia sp.]|uniref:hypothetical protein n=1 Tax=Trebonia sp. TaxID=2767075 RepID=UPI0026213B03|nr:hypothetical protein [Trebonia sp.]